MSGLTIDEPGTMDTKMQEVQTEIDTSRTKIINLEKELAERDKRVERLEADARSQRKRWLDESRAQSQTMNTLRAELEAKANNIAYLTTELHRLKQKEKSEQLGDQAGTGKHGGYPSSVSISRPGHIHPDSNQPVKASHTQHIPTPPSKDRTHGPSSASRIRRAGHGRSTLAGNVTSKPLPTVHPSSADALRARQANSLRKSSGRSSGSESPDITPFLPPPKDDLVQIIGTKQAPILPPITTSPAAAAAAALNVGSGAHPVLVHQVVSSSSQHRVKAKSSTTDASIATLAVANAVPDTAWSLAHKSHSSEFN